MYRKGFNTLDVFNRMAVGSGSIKDGITNYKDWRTVFTASVSMCVTNAYHAFIAVCPEQAQQLATEQGVPNLTQKVFVDVLSKQLAIYDPDVGARTRFASDSTVQGARVASQQPR